MNNEDTDPSARRKTVGLNRVGIGTTAFGPWRSEADLSRRVREDLVSRLFQQTKNAPSRTALPQGPDAVPYGENAVRKPIGGQTKAERPVAHTDRRVSSMRSYKPSLRDRAAWGVYDVFERFGAPGLGRLYAGRARQFVDFVPVLGDVVGVEEAGQDLYRGRYVEGTVGGLAAALGMVPAVGDAAAQMVRAGRRHVSTVVDRMMVGRRSVSDVPETQASANIDHRPVQLYDLPRVEETDIEVEYGRKPETDKKGNLLTDMDGRTMHADPARIVGRRHIDGRNQALGEDQYHGLADGVTEHGVSYVDRKHPALRMAFGMAYPTAWRRKADRLFVSNALRNHDKKQVLVHEIAHAVEFLGGPFNTRGLQDELKLLYHASNTGRIYDPKEVMFTPKMRDVRPSQYDREYVAEALRSYLRSPAAMKKHFPKTAARLREFVNANPRLNRLLYLNSLAALGGIGSATRGALETREDEPNGI